MTSSKLLELVPLPVASLELDSWAWFTLELDSGVVMLLELGSSDPFAEVLSLSQLAQKNPVKASASFFQCL
jgi:hypothetical protein